MANARLPRNTWVSKQTAPLLIMQGTKDDRVPAQQSELLAAKLKEAGADVTLEIIEGAGHDGAEFSTPQRLKMFDDFLSKHLLHFSFRLLHCETAEPRERTSGEGGRNFIERLRWIWENRLC
jgi:dienelactone hydrolase